MQTKLKILQKLYDDSSQDAKCLNLLNTLHEMYFVDIENLPEKNIEVLPMGKFLQMRELGVYNKKFLVDKIVIYLYEKDIYSEKRNYIISAFIGDVMLNKELQKDKFGSSDTIGVWGKHNLSKIFLEEDLDRIERRTKIHLLADTVVILDIPHHIGETMDMQASRYAKKTGSFYFMNDRDHLDKNIERYYSKLKDKYPPEAILDKYKGALINSLTNVIKRIDDIEVDDVLFTGDSLLLGQTSYRLRKRFTSKEDDIDILNYIQSELYHLPNSFNLVLSDPSTFLDFKRKITYLESL